MLSIRQFSQYILNARCISNGPVPGLKDIVFVDGVRTPFLTSGSDYKALMAYDLARMAVSGILNRTAVPREQVDVAILGTVIQETRTSNIAREALLGAGLSDRIPAFTETMACISSNRTACTGAELIRGGQASVALVGGVEFMSDVPIRYSRRLRQRLMGLSKAQKQGPLGVARHMLRGLSLAELFVPETPAIAEFSTGEVMGHSADRLAARFGVSRADQDAYAIRSHRLAAEATKKGLLEDLMPVAVPPKCELVSADNGIRGDMTPEGVAKLKPAFIKPHGTITAASSSFTTDGASAALLASPEGAQRAGLRPKAYLRDYVWVGQDPKEELLLGPAYAVARLLHRNKLQLGDFDVFEVHEAFAAQVLANLAALDDEKFCRGAGVPGKVGRVPMDKLNTLGGSLSIGHPFGATGIRLIATAANRLIQENGKLALLASCAAGGLGHAMIIERF